MNIHSLFQQGVLAACLLLLALGIHSQTSKSAADYQNGEVRRFRAFLADDWKRLMEDYPEFATYTGYPGQNRRWTDQSPAALWCFRAPS